MMKSPRFVSIILAISSASTASFATPVADNSPPISEIVRAAVSAPQFGEPQISPDGRWLYVHETIGDIGTDRYSRRFAVWSTDVRPGHALTLPQDVRQICGWHPSGALVVLREGGLAFLDPNTAQLSERPPGSAWASAPPISACNSGSVWSSDGQDVAFVGEVDRPTVSRVEFNATSGARAELTESGIRRMGLSRDQFPRSLFLWSGSRQAAQQIAASSTQVEPNDVDWSPDGRSLVFAADDGSRPGPYGSRHRELFLYEVGTGATRKLKGDLGLDLFAPRWSPTGLSIAYVSTPLSRRIYGPGASSENMVQIVDVAPGSSVSAPLRRDGPSGWIAWEGRFPWSSNGNRIYYTTASQGQNIRMRADRLASAIAEACDSEIGRVEYVAGTVNRAEDRYVFAQEAPNSPSAVFVSSLAGGERCPSNTSNMVSESPRGSDLSRLVNVEKLEWRSGSFSVYGILLTPANRARRSLPTIVSIHGGPVRVRFNFEGDYPVEFALAAQGYAVLVPNTRGRGGVSEGFARAIGDEHSRYRGPYADVMSGVDTLIGRGITDAEHIGIRGHSYGGGLTAYATTRTRRFRAAVISEAGGLNLTTEMSFLPMTERALLVRDFFGMHDPYSRHDRDIAIADSPLLHANLITTPSLLLFGDHALADTEGLPFYLALKRFSIPAEMYVYDMGHAPNNPRETENMILRTIEWFDYWLRNIEPRNPARAAEIEALRPALRENLGAP